MFRFKQFSVDDSRCAMKVGTDGVLLGAWAGQGYEDSFSEVLDIGTGSGLIALMIAQRCRKAHICGVEIDKEAAEQAAENFINSPWQDRLTAIQMSLQDYVKQERRFDVIVSNPPYFMNSLKTPDYKRTLARHDAGLSYEELIHSVAQLLLPAGLFATILPANEGENIINLCRSVGLILKRVCYVHGAQGKQAKRVLLEFFNKPKSVIPIESNTLVLESAPNVRSVEYAALTRDFYL